MYHITRACIVGFFKLCIGGEKSGTTEGYTFGSMLFASESPSFRTVNIDFICTAIVGL